MSSKRLADFTLSAQAEPPEILASVRATGVAVLEAFLSGPLLDAVRRDTDRLMTEAPKGAFVVQQDPHAHAYRIDHDILDLDAYASFRQIVFGGHLETVTALMFNDVYRYPMQLFVAESRSNRAFANELPYLLHIDREQALKFQFYLFDVTENDGPYSIAPGRHIEGCARRRQWRADGLGEWDRPNVVEGLDAEVVPLCGPAGTMIVFDTDVPHKHGVVGPNGYRKVFRIDTCGADMYF